MVQDFQGQGANNLELEHLMVFAACLFAASSSSSPSSSSSTAASSSWPALYASLRDWIFAALADGECAGLAAAVVERCAQAGGPVGGGAQVVADLGAPAVTLCFGTQDPACITPCVALLQRLVAEVSILESRGLVESCLFCAFCCLNWPLLYSVDRKKERKKEREREREREGDVYLPHLSCFFDYILIYSTNRPRRCSRDLNMPQQ